tara:strand:- start:784 stop:2178 length:1395 start_codon:yes stop_codon:yes gene_type:complete
VKKIEHDAGSFRDNAGSIFYFENKVLRILETEGEKRINFLLEKKLLDNPEIDKYLISSKITKDYDSQINNSKKKIVIEHSKIPYISYPYEWSFEQLKDAAIHHLDFHLFLLNNDANLIDASAYNIQFNGTKPKFIDILSIKKYVEGEFWAAHKQFCENFLNPLILKSKKGIDFNNWFKGNLEGIKTSDIYSMLNIYDFFSMNILTNVILMNYFDQKALKKENINVDKFKNKKLPKNTFISILRNLKKFISKLKAKKGKTVWDNYSISNTYNSDEEKKKRELVKDFVSKNKFNVLADIGCNDGVYSKLSLESGCRYVVGFDYDLNCVQNAYIKAKNENLNFLPLYFDATNPSVNLGWNEAERKGFKTRAKFDAVIALAFEHHLAIAKNIPLDQAVKWLIDLAPRGLIEFIPKNDKTIKKMLTLKGDIFNDYNENNFKNLILNHANIISETTISDSGRKLFEYVIK